MSQAARNSRCKGRTSRNSFPVRRGRVRISAAGATSIRSPSGVSGTEAPQVFAAHRTRALLGYATGRITGKRGGWARRGSGRLLLDPELTRPHVVHEPELRSVGTLEVDVVLEHGRRLLDEELEILPVPLLEGFQRCEPFRVAGQLHARPL